MILFIFNTIIAGVFGMRLFMAMDKGQRGTNAVTRLVRGTSAMRKYKTTLLICGAFSILYLVIGCVAKKPWVCIPTVIVAILAGVCMRKNTKDAQRVKDARVITKTGLKAGAATVKVAGEIGASALEKTGQKGKAKLLKAGTTTASSALNGVGNSMVDVDTPQLAPIVLPDPEAFLASCNRVGINTEGRDPSLVAADVLKFASPAQLDSLPDNLSDGEKAMRILGGV